MNNYSTTYPNLANYSALFWALICTVHYTVCSYHVTYAFQSEPNFDACLNIRELLSRSRRQIWSLSGCCWTRTHHHLLHKRTFNSFAKMVKWLSCIVNIYLYGAFDCMFLSCHVCVSQWIHTVWLPECQGTSSSKQAQNLKFKWLQLDSNPHSLSL